MKYVVEWEPVLRPRDLLAVGRRLSITGSISEDVPCSMMAAYMIAVSLETSCARVGRRRHTRIVGRLLYRHLRVGEENLPRQARSSFSDVINIGEHALTHVTMSPTCGRSVVSGDEARGSPPKSPTQWNSASMAAVTVRP